MSDLRTLLHDAVPAQPLIATSTADGDLARARRALRRRRTRRLSVGTGLVAAAAVGAFVIVNPSPSPTSTSVAPSTRSASVKLVAFTGKQPTGYTLDKVPSGWQIDEDNADILTLAPAGSTPPKTPKGVVSLKGKIAVMTESDTGVPTGIPLDNVTVGTRPGVIAHMDGDGDTRTLFVKQSSGVYLEIQVWSGLGWDNAQIVAFGNSVHINPGAKTTAG